MEANTAVQKFNSYIRLPQSAPFAKLSFKIKQVIGEIYSFTGKDNAGKELTCYRSYKKFSERCNASRATVGRALKIGRAEGLIEGNRKDGFKCLVKGTNDEFWRLPDWVMTDEFNVRENESRKLLSSERYLYALLFTRCTNVKSGRRTYSASIAQLAKESGLSERTIGKALWALIRANLIYRPKEDKGTNRYKISRYTLNYKLVLAKEKNAKKIRKEAERALKQQAVAADEEPFPEFSGNVGEEQFFLHTSKRKPAKHVKPKAKLHIPEVEQYQKPGSRLIDLEFDFNTASDEELRCLYNLYSHSPVYSDLDVISEAFITFVGLELRERKACGGGSPP